MFGTEPTPFDLQFALGRIPVRVLPTFWIASVLLGFDPDHLDLTFFWMLCVFVSILFHELGHALTISAFGYPTEIVLFHFGGYATLPYECDRSPLRSLLVTLAGPIPQLMAGLAMRGLAPPLLRGLSEQLSEQTWVYATAVAMYLIHINVWWALVNLLPVSPLDGGRCAEAIFRLVGLRDATGWARRVGMVTGMLAGAYFLRAEQVFAGAMFLMLAYQNWQQLQMRRW